MDIGAQPTILNKATANPEQSSSLLDNLVNELKTTPKQDYSENHQKAEEQYQSQQQQQTAAQEEETTIVNFEDSNRKSAEILVNVMNESIAFTCAIVAKEKESEQFKPSPLQTNTLVNAWADGFNQMGKAITIPWWIILVVLLPVAYAPPITKAISIRKTKVKAAKKPKTDKNQQSQTESEKQ
jgi:hypothetical protein